MRHTRRRAVGILAFLCGLAPTGSWGQVDLAPTVLMALAQGALQNVDPLVDPDPLFMFAEQTKTTTLTLRSFRFFGSIDLSAVCCYNPTTGAPAPSSGISVTVSPRQVSFQPVPSATATLTVTTSATPDTGAVLISVRARNVQQQIDARIFVLLTVLPPVPGDGRGSNCPRLTPAGTSPPALPEVLPVSAATSGLFTTKAGALTQTTFRLAVAANASGSGWVLTLDKATGVSPPLATNEALVVFTNTRTWNKALATVNSADCNAAPQVLSLTSGQTGTIRISRSNVTTLLLTRTKCTFWLFVCWGTVSQDVAYFNEAAFWTLVGGRRITLSWDISVQGLGGFIER